MNKPINGLVSTNKGSKKVWPPEDYLKNRAPSEMLAGTINDYWLEKGLAANARVEQSHGTPGGPCVYIIISDMLNGQPRTGATNVTL